MSFTLFPRQSTLGSSDWNQWMTSMSGTTDKVDDALLSARRTTQTTTSVDNSRKIADRHQAALTTPLPHARRSALVNQADRNSTSAQLCRLKSSLRQAKLTTLAPFQQEGGKSVKFDPLHLEKICLFEENQSPSETPSFDQLNYPIFKVEYSQWPIVTLSKHQQNVQLKRFLKIQQDGSILHGQVVVRNLGYEKVVEIRYSVDGWQTVRNTQATYLHGRGSMDMFVFDLDLQHSMADRGHLRVIIDMAVRYTVRVTDNDYIARQKEHHHYHHNEEATFWDNNDGHNYQIQIVEADIKRSAVTPALSLKTGSHVAIDESKDTTDPLARRSRYNFDHSLLNAKLNSPLPSLSPAAPPSPPLSPSLAATLDPGADSSGVSDTSSSSPFSPHYHIDSYKASLASNERPAAPLPCPNDNHPLASPSYSDLVNKYCFYGSH